MEKVSISKRLKTLMSERNLKQIDIIRMSEPYQREYSIKLGKSHLSEYVNGKTTPDSDKIFLLAKTLEVSEPWLMGYDVDINPSNSIDNPTEDMEVNLVNNYRTLSTEGKHTLVDFSDALVRDENNKVKEDIELYSVDVTEAVAAGIGYRYGNNETTTYYTDRSDLKGYDYATLVRGDSMYPTFKDGDIVLIRSGYDNVNGDVYVIDYDGKSYVKKLYNDGDRFRLVSINENYNPIRINVPIEDGAYFNIVGKVVDSFTPIKK